MKKLSTNDQEWLYHRFFKQDLRSRARGVAFLCFILLLSGCGGEESVDNPVVETTSGVTPNEAIPISTKYFPMTVGNRWVYRNPDGSEWSREVTETQTFGVNLYHSFSYNPPIQDNQLDSLGAPVYAAYLDRLDHRLGLNDINDVVREIILESGGGTQDWSIGTTCVKKLKRKPWCVPKKNIFKPGILAYLYNANASVVWHSKLTLLRFPLSPGETYKTLDLRLRGRYEGRRSYIHAYEAEGVILGTISDDREFVEVYAGAFEDCLKIQYEAKLASYNTEEFSSDSEYQGAQLEALESVTREELTDLLKRLVPKLGLRTVWLAPGVGPVKIETPNGIAELIDYEIKALASESLSHSLSTRLMVSD